MVWFISLSLSVNLAGLKLGTLPTSASQVLELHVYATAPGTVFSLHYHRITYTSPHTALS